MWIRGVRLRSHHAVSISGHLGILMCERIKAVWFTVWRWPLVAWWGIKAGLCVLSTIYISSIQLLTLAVIIFRVQAYSYYQDAVSNSFTCGLQGNHTSY
jgi:hypothetical protein